MEKLSAKKNKRQMPSLSLRDISPRGRDKLDCAEKQKIRSGFSALPLGELAFASK